MLFASSNEETDILKMDHNNVSKIFFSNENIKRIQKKIKKEIKKKMRVVLTENQDERDLLVVMKSTFLQYSKNYPDRPVAQVKELNNKLIELIIPGIITNIKQYYGYIKEINEPLKPIPRPINVNNAGRKTLPSVTTIWNI